MELEQKEKMEKNKKLKLSLPYSLKSFNLKAKTNPVQNLFSKDNDDNDNDFYNKKNQKNNLDINKDDEIKNEKEEKDKINNGENDENEEEEEGVIKKEEKEEKQEKEKNEEKKDIVDNKKDINISIDENKGNGNNEEYNDVNYWGIGFVLAFKLKGFKL